MPWSIDKNGTWKNKAPWNQVIEKQWPFRPTDADDRYDEAYIITDSGNPVWQYPFGYENVQDEHEPCGYWIGTALYYTTWTFNPYNIDELWGQIQPVSGIHDYVKKSFEIPEEDIEALNQDVVEGDLHRVSVYYDIGVEEIEAVGQDVVEGDLHNVFEEFDAGDDEIESIGYGVSGHHKWVVRYQNWYLIIDDETLECTGMDLIEGDHSEN